jgi:hypothetical protein
MVTTNAALRITEKATEFYSYSRSLADFSTNHAATEKKKQYILKMQGAIERARLWHMSDHNQTLHLQRTSGACDSYTVRNVRAAGKPRRHACIHMRAG